MVCEGSKTETHYIGQFVAELRAVNVRIDIFGKECGTDPQSVVEYAVTKFREDAGYDSCFCVIDRDRHDRNRLIRAIELTANWHNKYRNRTFQLIISNPSIEYWFLLHFVFSRAPYAGSGRLSPGDQVTEALKRYLPDYSKGDASQLSAMFPLLNTAKENAERAIADARDTQEWNPSTEMQVLVQAIQDEIARV